MLNIYRFTTLTAAAITGLSLLTSGCADNGGTSPFAFSPAPSGDKAILKVQFAIAASKAEVPAEAAAYTFHLNIGKKENKTLDNVAKKGDDDNPSVQTVTLEADPQVDNVLVEYLTEDGKTIAVSQFPVELAKDQTTVADDFGCLEASSLVIKGSADVIHIGDDLTLTASVIYGDEFSEDAIEREVSNDDMTYELTVPEDKDAESTHCFEPKQGENGTFTATAAGNDYIQATYTDELTSWYYPTVLADDEEITSFCLWVQDFGSLEEHDNNIRMLYADNPLPERFKMNVPPPDSHETGIIGVNDAVINLVGMTSNETAVKMQAEWSGEGDYLQVQGAGQEGRVHLTGAGTGGTITATYGEGDIKETISATLTGAKATASAMLPVTRKEIDNGNGSHTVYVEAYMARLKPGDTLQLYPGGAYYYEDDPNGPVLSYGCYGTNTDDTITWSMEEGFDESITIDSTGLVTVAEDAQDDFSIAKFTISDYEPDHSQGCEIFVNVP